MHQRRRLIDGALDQFYAANQAALPDDANTNVGGSLVGKLDMTRIGLMGHSRGGDGISSFLDYNRMRAPSEGRRWSSTTRRRATRSCQTWSSRKVHLVRR